MIIRNKKGQFAKGNSIRKNAKLSLAIRKKIGDGNRGKKLSEATKLKMRQWKRKEGEESHAWKGDNAGKIAIHEWIRKNLPKPKLCPHCNKKPPTDVANLNNHIYRRKLKDFIWLCRSCHLKLDRN